MIAIPLLMCVAGCNSQVSSLAVEGHGSNTGGVLRRLEEALLIFTIPANHIELKAECKARSIAEVLAAA